MTERRRLRPSARLRILAWILGLTALAVVSSLVLSWRLLQRQLDARVNDHLEQEVDEVRRLAGGRDPATGQPFGADVTAIFSTFLQRNLPSQGEAFFSFVDGELYRATPAPEALGDDPDVGGRWAQLTAPEARIASFLEKGLRANGFATTVVDDGRVAAAAARDRDYDLLILDLALPSQHGLEVLSQLRGRGERLPVIILTARDELDTTLAGFTGGADDYVTKPFRFEELLARIRARLRDDASRDPTMLRAGDVALDLQTRRATVGDRTVELTAREFALAETFLRHPDQVLTREQLLSHVWGYDFDPESNVVDVYVRYLRRKLGEGVIETRRGMGYRLVTGG